MKRIALFIFMAIVIFGLIGCTSATQAAAESPVEQVNAARDWEIGVWNYFVDIDSYVFDGKSATGESLDIDFAIEQFNKAMEDKSECDASMSALEGYDEITSVWSKLSEQLDLMSDYVNSGVEVGGERFDTGLYDQYSTAFDDLVYALD